MSHDARGHGITLNIKSADAAAAALTCNGTSCGMVSSPFFIIKWNKSIFGGRGSCTPAAPLLRLVKGRPAPRVATDTHLGTFVLTHVRSQNFLGSLLKAPVHAPRGVTRTRTCSSPMHTSARAAQSRLARTNSETRKNSVRRTGASSGPRLASVCTGSAPGLGVRHGLSE